jgi:3-deoxy-7-phosphoheptulonate synthase
MSKNIDNQSIPTDLLRGIESKPSEQQRIDPYEAHADASERPLWRRNGARPQTCIQLGDALIGGETFVLIAGPCSVESQAQLAIITDEVAATGAHALRGGVYKPRSDPYSFQGLGADGLELLAAEGRRVGLPIVTEVMDPALVPLVASHADVLQVGARNMQNYALLRALGRARRPVLLKRGLGNTVDELLGAAEYLLAEGNPEVILCERGIRTFENSTRFTLDVAAIPILRERTHLPVIVDPSHAAGRRELVPALARAAKAVGAHGVIVEIHHAPEQALSDGPQALRLPEWRRLAQELHGHVLEPW